MRVGNAATCAGGLGSRSWPPAPPLVQLPGAAENLTSRSMGGYGDRVPVGVTNGGEMGRALVTMGLLAGVGLLAACGGGSSSTEPQGPSPVVSVPSIGQAACDAYFEAVKTRDEIGFTVTPDDMALLNTKLDAAIAAFRSGAESEPAMGQSAEELQTMRAELNKPQVNSMLVAEAAELVNRTCLETLAVTPPDWLLDRAGLS